MSRGKGHVEPFVIAIFFIALDIALMAPLLVTLSQHFAITHRWASWVIALYLAVFSFALPFAESWTRRIDGRRRWGISLSLLALGSIVGAIAPAWMVLLAGRMLQALGASGTVPLLVQGLRQSRRPMLVRALGRLMPALLILVPLLSSFLNRQWGWRAVFVAFLPLILLLLLIARRLQSIRPPRPSKLQGLESGSTFFFLGSLLFAMIAVTRMEGVAGWKEILHPEVFPLLDSFPRIGCPPGHGGKAGGASAVYSRSGKSGFHICTDDGSRFGNEPDGARDHPGWITPIFPDWLEIGGIGLAIVALAVGPSLLLARWIAGRWGSRIALSAGFMMLSLSSFILGVSRNFTLVFPALLLLGGGDRTDLGSAIPRSAVRQMAPSAHPDGFGGVGHVPGGGGCLGLLLITRLIDERDFQAGEALMMVTAVSLAGSFLALRLPGCRRKREGW